MPETEQAPSTTTWDGAASPNAAGRVRKFESAWASSRTDRRPDPRNFLPAGNAERPAALLALLQAEIGLRWEAGDRVEVELYRDRYPELDEDGLVALIYEEFCLREEAGDAPTPIEYEERFPELTPRLRRVFDIHDLVGAGGSAAFRVSATPEVPFPESGQTTAGFRLLEELGRGSFARVFLAEERQLADRPVALKVSRTGSREPQTLARLQHTHIVPVHSYRTDPATGLHLLCMPYFGRVTFEQILADPAWRTAATGSDVLAALDRLEPSGRGTISTARSHFARLTFAQAIGWWGARMAEGLAHAHERGVLHRDVKPSNVLVTSDGVPMLLDFNLARDPRTEAAGASLGGTLAYMAPEHIEALSRGDDEGVDQRCDVFSLGVLLFEALTGRRPFSSPTRGSTVAEALERAAQTRRSSVLSLRETHPEIPPAMESVVLKCLAVDRSRRYRTASDLAADLQAVADDTPLIHAREPFGSRTMRLARRHRWPIALACLTVLTWMILAQAVVRAREDQKRIHALLSEWVERGDADADAGRFGEAITSFRAAIRLAMTTPDFAHQPILVSARDSAANKLREATLAIRAHAHAETLFHEGARIRIRRIDPREIREAMTRIDAAIRPFVSTDSPTGLEVATIARLDAARRDRVEREVRELLYRKALLGAGLRESRDEALIACVLGSRSAIEIEPWKALVNRLGGAPPIDVMPETRSAESSLLFAALLEADGNPELASALLKRAARLNPTLPGLYDQAERVALASGDVTSAAAFAAKARERPVEKAVGDRSWDRSR